MAAKSGGFPEEKISGIIPKIATINITPVIVHCKNSINPNNIPFTSCVTSEAVLSISPAKTGNINIINIIIINIFLLFIFFS